MLGTMAEIGRRRAPSRAVVGSPEESKVWHERLIILPESASWPDCVGRVGESEKARDSRRGRQSDSTLTSELTDGWLLLAAITQSGFISAPMLLGPPIANPDRATATARVAHPLWRIPAAQGDNPRDE